MKEFSFNNALNSKCKRFLFIFETTTKKKNTNKKKCWIEFNLNGKYCIYAAITIAFEMHLWKSLLFEMSALHKLLVYSGSKTFEARDEELYMSIIIFIHGLVSERRRIAVRATQNLQNENYLNFSSSSKWLKIYENVNMKTYLMHNLVNISLFYGYIFLKCNAHIIFLGNYYQQYIKENECW